MWHTWSCMVMLTVLLGLNTLGWAGASRSQGRRNQRKQKESPIDKITAAPNLSLYQVQFCFRLQAILSLIFRWGCKWLGLSDLFHRWPGNGIWLVLLQNVPTSWRLALKWRARSYPWRHPPPLMHPCWWALSENCKYKRPPLGGAVCFCLTEGLLLYSCKCDYAFCIIVLKRS